MSLELNHAAAGGATAARDRGSAGHSSAWWKAQELLARRDHGTRELIVKLERRGFSNGEISAVVKRLTEKGLLDDEAFAGRLVEELFFRRGYGWYAILARLQKKGLSYEVAERACREFFSTLPEEELTAVIRHQLERKKRRESDRARLFAWLKNRGFRSREIDLVMGRRDYS